jgi:hypothetical protein
MEMRIQRIRDGIDGLRSLGRGSHGEHAVEGGGLRLGLAGDGSARVGLGRCEPARGGASGRASARHAAHDRKLGLINR